VSSIFNIAITLFVACFIVAAIVTLKRSKIANVMAVLLLLNQILAAVTQKLLNEISNSPVVLKTFEVQMTVMSLSNGIYEFFK